MNDYSFDNFDDNREMGYLSEESPLDLDNQIRAREKKFGMTDNNYNVLMHLSQYFSFILPFAGVIAPFILWLRVKNEDPEVDRHGKAILNWNFTLMLIYFVCILLFLIVIGFLLIWIPIILGLVFPIFGAINANDGKLWKYPLSIKFL